MAGKVQLTGGSFQDAEGNVLANGYLTMELNQDALTNPAGELCSGITVKILLDANGNVSQSPAQFIWPNDALNPSNSFYVVTAYTAAGQPVWGPNTQQVITIASGLFNVSAWTPNTVVKWNPTPYNINFETVGVTNSTQATLNIQGDNAFVTAANTSGGNVSLAATGALNNPIPRPDAKIAFWWTPAHIVGSGNPANGVSSYIDTAPITGFFPPGGVFGPTTTTSLMTQFACANGIGAGFIGGDMRTWIGPTGGRTVLLEGRFQLGTILTGSNFFFGFINEQGSFGDILGPQTTLNTTRKRLGLVFDNRVSANFYIESCDGTTESHTITTLAAALTTSYKFSMTYNPTAQTATFSINGTNLGTLSTSMPVDTPMTALFGCGPYNGNNMSLFFEYLYSEQTSF